MDLDMAKWIIGGMATGMVAMAGYIVKQHLAERAILKAWLHDVQAVNAMLIAKPPASTGGA